MLTLGFKEYPTFDSLFQNGRRLLTLILSDKRWYDRRIYLTPDGKTHDQFRPPYLFEMNINALPEHYRNSAQREIDTIKAAFPSETESW